MPFHFKVIRQKEKGERTTMPLFDISPSSKAKDSAIIKKSKTKSTVTKKSGGNIVDRVKMVVAKVETALGKYADETLVVQDEQTLHEYIDKCISNGIYAIDTETTGLDPLVDELVGVGIYTPGEKTIYIPVNHISYVTGQKIKNQLSADIIGKELARLDGIDCDMFNAPFDIRVLKHSTGTRLKCTWDSFLGARCLNENEPTNKLKKLHQKYVLKGLEDEFSFDELFKGIDFRMIPVKTAGLYAAHDPKITWEYGEYQRNIFRTRENLKDVFWVFQNIEMPVVDVVVDMEDTGIEFDMEYNHVIKEKYHKILDEKESNFHKLCEMYQDEIDNYKGTTKLDKPINIQSVPQLQALLYDIAKLPLPLDKKKQPTRSTSEESLKQLKSPLADAILEYRAFSTLVSTFIDKMPECVNKKDGRIHCKFNQYGADTGRFSSQDPNLQNIPHTADIRQMFKATSSEYIVSTNDDVLELERFTEVETPTGWKYSDTLHSGDLLLITDDDGEAEYEIDNVEVLDDKVIIRLYSPS